VNVYKDLPSDTVVTMNLAINSQTFNNLNRDDKRVFLTGLSKLKELDDRIPIDYEDIKVIGSGDQFSNYRYKSRENRRVPSVLNSNKIYYNENVIDPFSIMRFRQVEVSDDGSGMLINPCFNKGYYNKELNFTGNGDYETCYKYINNELDQNETKISLPNFNITNNTVVLENSQFKQFKFLFYDKNAENNIYHYNDEITYTDLKNKIINLCGKQYSYLIAELTRFHIPKLFNMCFEATYLTITLERYGVNNENLVKLLSHKKIDHKNGSQFDYKQLLMPRNIVLLTLLLASLLGSVVLFYANEPVVNLIKDNFTFILPDDRNIDNILQYQKVKQYLFFSNESYFKNKYGKDFVIENYDMIIIKNDIIELIGKDAALKELIDECEKEYFNMKLNLMASLLQIVLLLLFLICFCLLFNSVNSIDSGCLKIVVTISSMMFVVLVLMVSLKTLIKLENKEKNNEDKYILK
jgi:hypothetical protein